MSSYIAAFALQQLRDMEELQRDSRVGRARRRRRRESRPEQDALARVQPPAELWTLRHQTRRTRGVSASTTGVAEH